MQLSQHYQEMGTALLATRATSRPDAPEIAAAVKRYCTRLRANASDTAAAVNWALRHTGDTLSAIRAGRHRAAQLHWRSTQSTPTEKA
ncbi:hypothetical protein [Arenimonas fontis]|uniref:Uncharacterized protein n=1 Tax=Arenimonas fontis TaxID=2608255 RepID=A0A5B2ZDY7_9GAMM|nr:hypothetical protein [Arenimonas fontis]KAA2285454.1 hypothetical protein F0415_05955 [Arenimonas fontis]